MKKQSPPHHGRLVEYKRKGLRNSIITSTSSCPQSRMLSTALKYDNRSGWLPLVERLGAVAFPLGFPPLFSSKALRESNRIAATRSALAVVCPRVSFDRRGYSPTTYLEHGSGKMKCATSGEMHFCTINRLSRVVINFVPSCGITYLYVSYRRRLVLRRCLVEVFFSLVCAQKRPS